jgi:hypothetical protein
MKSVRLPILMFLTLVWALAVAARAADPNIEKKQQDIRSMAQSTLLRLYKADPKAKVSVQDAAGYAVFSNLGIKILVAGSGNGKGVAINKKTRRETFMKMLELQAGLGIASRSSALSSSSTPKRRSTVS